MSVECQSIFSESNDLFYEDGYKNKTVGGCLRPIK